MAKKPTYQELEQRVREYEAEAARRRRAEEALRASEAKLVDNLKNNYFLYSHDPDGNLTYVSPTISNVLGYSREEFVVNFRDYLTDNPVNHKPSRYPEISMSDGELPSYEVEIYHKDGSRRWLEIAEVPVFGEEGEILAVENIVHDITFRKQAEESLLQEKNKLEAVFATIGDGLIIQDLDYRILYQNEPHKENYGRHQGEYCYAAYHKRELPCDDCPLTKCFQDGQVHRVEKRVEGSKGVRFLEVSAGPIRDAKGDIAGGFEIVRDITEHKRLAAQFMQAQKMESVGRLAGGVAHDFNNLLTGIIGYTGLALDQVRGGEALEGDLREILALSKRAANLTRQLLAFSRQQTMEPREVNINILIDELSKMLRRLLGEDIELEFSPASDLATVKADPGQIEQILTNLALNARAAMPDGGLLAIKTENVYMDKSDGFVHGVEVRAGNYVMFSVADNGCGMERAVQERIFEPFFTTKEIGEGSGLGLSMVYGIIKQHHGFIWVYSEPGVGSVFKVYLPRLEKEEARDLQEQESGAMAGGGETLLLVEDDDDVRKVTCRMLKNLGYVVLETANPVEAEEVFAREADRIDLLLTDIVMPGSNGKELHERLAGRVKGLKVLYMSGYTRDVICKKGGILAPDTALISKPFSQEKLGRKIREVLARPEELPG